MRGHPTHLLFLLSFLGGKPYFATAKADNAVLEFGLAALGSKVRMKFIMLVTLISVSFSLTVIIAQAFIYRNRCVGTCAVIMTAIEAKIMSILNNYLTFAPTS